MCCQLQVDWLMLWLVYSWEGGHAGRKVREQVWAGHVLHCKAHGSLALQTSLTDPVLYSEPLSHFPVRPWVLDNLTLSHRSEVTSECSSLWVGLGGHMNLCLLPQILLKYDLTSAALLGHLPVQEEQVRSPRAGAPHSTQLRKRLLSQITFCCLDFSCVFSLNNSR